MKRVYDGLKALANGDALRVTGKDTMSRELVVWDVGSDLHITIPIGDSEQGMKIAAMIAKIRPDLSVTFEYKHAVSMHGIKKKEGPTQ